MMRAFARRRTDAGFRIAGLGLCALAWGCVRYLARMPVTDPPHWTPDLSAYGLAAVGFVCASVGGVLATLGARIFAPVEVSERWRAVSSLSFQGDTRF